jgi:major vault protein
VPPRQFCIIKNPVARDDDGEIVKDMMGQIKLLHADLEIRLTQDPFPLYPGEELEAGLKPLTVVPAMAALRLRVTRDFKDGETNRLAGDEYLFEGPGTYLPRIEVEVLATVRCQFFKLLFFFELLYPGPMLQLFELPLKHQRCSKLEHFSK